MIYIVRLLINGDRMKKEISYGDQLLTFFVPNKMKVIEIAPHAPKPEAPGEVLIRQALEHPIGASLTDLMLAGKRVCLICDDISRPTPVQKILEVLLPQLVQLGVRREDIYLVFALGSHRRMTPAEVQQKLGAQIAAEFPVYQSSFSDPSELLELGSTEDGIPITVYRRIMDSEIRIGIGNIVPHNTLGWSGGCKILFPGVTSEQTVCRFHMKAMLGRTGQVFGLAENAVRSDVERWAGKIGLHFLINTILTRTGEIYRVVAGDCVQAHRQGVGYAREVYAVQVPQKADIVVVDSHPSDCDFWQGTKGFNAANVLLKDGGSCVLVSPFYEGVGPHAQYPAMIGCDGADALLNEMYVKGPQAFPEYDPLALSVGAMIGRMRRRFSMYAYTDGMSTQALAEAGIQKTRDLSKTLFELSKQYGSGAVLAIVHDGAEIVPEIASTR